MTKETFPKWIRNMKKHPIWTIKYIVERLFGVHMDDEIFLRLLYEFHFEKPLDLENPKSFNEKLQWLKLHDRKKTYTTMVDKYAVKKYVADIIGEQYIIPVYGVWDRFDDIDFDKLPNRFVVKCSHDSGSVMMVKNKDAFDKMAAKEKFKNYLRNDFYYLGREWPYKNIKPRILAEMYLEDKADRVLMDYKIWCFEGEAKLVEVLQGRGTVNFTQDFYDIKWNKINIQQKGYLNSPESITKPKQLGKMIELSNKLAMNTHYVRVDWYIAEDQIYFGEVTFFNDSGFCGFLDDATDNMLGSWIKLET